MKHKINTALFIALIGLEIYLFRDSDYFLSILIITVCAFLAVIGIGVLFIRLNYFLTSKYRTGGDKVLLTFDDGPEPEKTEKVLEILKKHDVSAVFFLIGKKVEAHKEIAEKIVKEGHLIGNHTYSHNNFAALHSTGKLVEEMEKTEKILDDLSSERPKLFRPPIGYTTPNYARALKRVKMQCVGWRLRSYDTLSKDVDKFANRLVNATRKGDIVLFHDNLDITVESLSKYIEDAKRNGIIFVSKDEVKNLFV